MLIKRHYSFPEGWEPKRDERGELLNPPPISHMEVKHTGASAEQHFSTTLVEAGVSQGFISAGKGRLVLHAKPEDLHYTVKRGPGHYCCHCGESLPDAAAFVSPGVTAGMQHVAAMHPGKASPDAGNPAGYERLHHYDCVLDKALHEKYRVKPGGGL